tara:strand:- start:24 stop:227 length:204 start_codon:yes stop_codon:yes gene_type:complete
MMKQHSTPTDCPYKNEGFDTRKDYIANLKKNWPPELVDLCTSLLPASEDFDGLITTLENEFESGNWD